MCIYLGKREQSAGRSCWRRMESVTRAALDTSVHRQLIVHRQTYKLLTMKQNTMSKSCSHRNGRHGRTDPSGFVVQYGNVTRESNGSTLFVIKGVAIWLACAFWASSTPSLGRQFGTGLLNGATLYVRLAVSLLFIHSPAFAGNMKISATGLIRYVFPLCFLLGRPVDMHFDLWRLGYCAKFVLVCGCHFAGPCVRLLSWGATSR